MNTGTFTNCVKLSQIRNLEKKLDQIETKTSVVLSLQQFSPRIQNTKVLNRG